MLDVLDAAECCWMLDEPREYTSRGLVRVHSSRISRTCCPERSRLHPILVGGGGRATAPQTARAHVAGLSVRHAGGLASLARGRRARKGRSEPQAAHQAAHHAANLRQNP